MKISQPVIEIIKRIDEDDSRIEIIRSDLQCYDLRIYKDYTRKEYRVVAFWVNSFGWRSILGADWLSDEEEKELISATQSKIERDKTGYKQGLREEFIGWLGTDK